MRPNPFRLAGQKWAAFEVRNTLGRAPAFHGPPAGNACYITANDSFTIVGGSSIRRQVRKCNQKLRRGERSRLKDTAPWFMCGFRRYDKVLWKGIECVIVGRRTSGSFDLRKKMDCTEVSASAKALNGTLLESAKTILTERTRLPLHSGLAA
ncbi:MAG: hypothetical protein ABR903_06425 [Thermodesulfovibrionales bacterium]|jgi:hypothetical protein